jgi:plasmid stabilization system protein ParE
MEMKIEWSESSKAQLREIFGYYNSNAGWRIARKIVVKITSTPRIL